MAGLGADAGLQRYADGGLAHAIRLDRGDRRKRVRARLDDLGVERARGVAAGVVGVVDGQIRRRLPLHLRMDAAAVIGAEIGSPGQRVLNCAIARGDDAIHLHAEIVPLGQVEVDLALVAAEIADAASHVEVEISGRLLGGDVERAALGIAPEQRALRSLEHFDAVQVVKGGVQTLRTAEIDAVDIDADTGFTRRLVGVRHHADAADVQDQVERTRGVGRDGQAGRPAGDQVGQRLDVAIDEIDAVQHRNRDWRLLQIFRPLLGGDDHFAEAVLRRGGGRGGSGRGRSGSVGGETGGRQRGDPESTETGAAHGQAPKTDPHLVPHIKSCELSSAGLANRGRCCQSRFASVNTLYFLKNLCARQFRKLQVRRRNDIARGKR